MYVYIYIHTHTHTHTHTQVVIVIHNTKSTQISLKDDCNIFVIMNCGNSCNGHHITGTKECVINCIS